MPEIQESGVVRKVLDRLRPVRLRRRGAALALCGEAGIGKSHAAQEVLRRSELRSFTFAARTPLADLALQLPRPKALGLWTQTQLSLLQRGDGAAQEHAVKVVCEVLAGLAPVILLLEDLHELRPEQVGQVQSLATAVQNLRGVALLVTGRQAAPEPFESHSLGPLDETAFGELLEAELRGSLPPEARHWLTARARGNPLFGLESLRYLARQGHLWNDGQSWRWRRPAGDWLPVTVETLIERLLQDAASTSETRAALEAFALLPDGVSAEQWAEVAGLTLTDLLAARTLLGERGVLQEQADFRRVTFSHPLFREVARRSGLLQERQRLAERAVRVLRTSDPLAAAALVPAAGLEPEAALDLLLEAARHAELSGLRGRAGRLLASASQVAVGTRRAGLALDAARALLRVDLPEAEALEALGEAGPEPGSRPARRLVLSMLARNIPQALALWRQHPELHASEEVPVLLAGLRALVNTGALTEARTVLDAVSARSDLSAVDRLTLETQEAVLLLQSGELTAAAERLDALAPRLLAAGEERAAATVRHNQGVALERSSRYAEAVVQELEAARLYAAAGDQRGFASVRTAAAWNLWHFGRYEEAETLFLEAREVLRGSAFSIMLVECEGMLSLLYLDWSPPLAVDLAQRYASSALSIAREIADASGTGACLYDLAMVRIRQGRWDEALALVTELDGLCAEHGFQGLVADARFARALVLEGLGRPSEALPLLRQAAADNAAGSVLFTRKIETEVARLSGDLDLARRLLSWFRERGLRNEERLLLRAVPGLGAAQAEGGAAPRAQSRLRLEVLGPMRLRQGEEFQNVRGGRRRDLLALLLAARLSGRSQVSRLDLLDALYPGLPEGPAASSLRDLVHQVRHLCGPGVVLTTPDGYALDAIGSDAEAFLATGELALWRGVVWQDVGLAEQLGETRGVLLAALRTRVRGQVEQHPVEAERQGHILLDADPYDLSSLRLLLTAMRADGHHTSLNRTYARARARLNEVGEELPGAWTTFLAGSVGVLG